ncbi:NUDIX domain-containing protein [Streptomyces sparsogenes]|uniref:NUDIX domain-containing protein n=1 Tax=Streptomyces sparsogenes TaxID=67365 RepID=UPI00384A92A6
MTHADPALVLRPGASEEEHTRETSATDDRADIDLDGSAPRRVGAVVLVLDPRGRVLLVRPTYGTRAWQLPGGGVHKGEPATAGAARELEEETGLDRQIRYALAIDQMPGNSNSAEGYNIVCDGGVLSEEEAAAVVVPESARDEISECAWVPLSALDEKCDPYQARRIRQALTARSHGARIPILLQGRLAAV